MTILDDIKSAVEAVAEKKTTTEKALLKRISELENKKTQSEKDMAERVRQLESSCKQYRKRFHDADDCIKAIEYKCLTIIDDDTGLAKDDEIDDESRDEYRIKYLRSGIEEIAKRLLLVERIVGWGNYSLPSWSTETMTEDLLKEIAANNRELRDAT